MLLAHGSPDEVREHCKKVIDGVARDGGYIMDASAIVQNDAKVENIRAMTDFTREYGVYSSGCSDAIPEPSADGRDFTDARLHPSAEQVRRVPGVCQPWEEKRRELGAIQGDEPLCRRIWEETDSLAYHFLFQVLLSF